MSIHDDTAAVGWLLLLTGGAAVVKRRGRNVSEAYVVVPLSTFADLLGEAP